MKEGIFIIDSIERDDAEIIDLNAEYNIADLKMTITPMGPSVPSSIIVRTYLSNPEVTDKVIEYIDHSFPNLSSMPRKNGAYELTFEADYAKTASDNLFQPTTQKLILGHYDDKKEFKCRVTIDVVQ